MVTIVRILTGWWADGGSDEVVAFLLRGRSRKDSVTRSNCHLQLCGRFHVAILLNKNWMVLHGKDKDSFKHGGRPSSSSCLGAKLCVNSFPPIIIALQELSSPHFPA